VSGTNFVVPIWRNKMMFGLNVQLRVGIFGRSHENRSAAN